MKSTIKSYDHFIHKKTRCGLMFLNRLDQYISRDLIHKGTWEKYLYPVFEKYIKQGDCVLDIGANIGAHSLIFSDLVKHEGSVHCFEPLSELFFQLKLNLLLNKKNNCTIYNVGLSDTNYVTTMPNLKLDESNNFGAYSLNTDIKKQSKSLFETDTVHVTTLDDLLLKPDFIKMDAEGFEDKILLGGKNTITKYKPIMLIEIHKNDLNKVTNILAQINYKIVQKYGPWDYLCIPLTDKLSFQPIDGIIVTY